MNPYLAVIRTTIRSQLTQALAGGIKSLSLIMVNFLEFSKLPQCFFRVLHLKKGKFPESASSAFALTGISGSQSERKSSCMIIHIRNETFM